MGIFDIFDGVYRIVYPLQIVSETEGELGWEIERGSWSTSESRTQSETDRQGQRETEIGAQRV